MNSGIEITDFTERVRTALGGSFNVHVESGTRIRVFTPFELEDGDRISLSVERSGDEWRVSDQGFVYTHLTYDIDEHDLQSGNRHKMIENVMSSFDVRLAGRAIMKSATLESLQHAIFDVLQAAIKMSHLLMLSRERVRTTFLEDLKATINGLPGVSVKQDWYDVVNDPSKRYKVDFRVESSRVPIFVYGIAGETKARDATIALLKFKQWAIPIFSIGVFQDATDISKPVLHRFSEASDELILNMAPQNKTKLVNAIEQRTAA